MGKFHDLLSVHDSLDVNSASESIIKNVQFRGINVWILAFAIIIASVGLNVNSTAVIIGAMLISPLMGPIMGMGLAIGTIDIKLLRTSFINLGIMVLISVIASTVFFLVSPLNMQNPSELLARTTPTIYDVMVAFFGGAAGAFETARKEKGTVIAGVAIATALMPPLCTVGYGVANMNLQYALGAFYLFFINCIFVALATVIVVKYLNFPMVKETDPGKEKKMRFVAFIVLIAIIVPSVLSAIQVVRENDFNIRVANFVESNKLMDDTIIYDYKTEKKGSKCVAVLRLAGMSLSDEERLELYQNARKDYGIDEDQLILEESSFIRPDTGSDFEKQVYDDLNEKMSVLRQRIAQYENSKIPYDQLTSEVLALYPQLSSFDIAANDKDVIAICYYKDKKSQHIANQLTEWLKVRLERESVKVLEITANAK